MADDRAVEGLGRVAGGAYAHGAAAGGAAGAPRRRVRPQAHGDRSGQATVSAGAGTAIRNAFEAREIVDAVEWATMQNDGGWLPRSRDGTRREADTSTPRWATISSPRQSDACGRTPGRTGHRSRTATWACRSPRDGGPNHGATSGRGPAIVRRDPSGRDNSKNDTTLTTIGMITTMLRQKNSRSR